MGPSARTNGEAATDCAEAILTRPKAAGRREHRGRREKRRRRRRGRREGRVETEAEAELHLRGADRCECEGEAKGCLVVTDCTEAKATTGMEAEAAASLPSCYALRSIHAVHNSPISPSRVQQVPTVSCIFLIIFLLSVYLLFRPGSLHSYNNFVQ